MWLDGLYMGEPFYAEYSLVFNQTKNFDDIINQFAWMEKNARDAKTGLLYHAWDESREQKWADPKTGKSPNFWSRAIGWYGLALVDVLDYVPQNHPRRGELIAILNRLAPAIVKFQDPKAAFGTRLPTGWATKATILKPQVQTCLCIPWPKVCGWATYRRR